MFMRLLKGAAIPTLKPFQPHIAAKPVVLLLHSSAEHLRKFKQVRRKAFAFRRITFYLLFRNFFSFSKLSSAAFLPAL